MDEKRAPDLPPDYNQTGLPQPDQLQSEQSPSNDQPPAYPDNPVQFEGYGNLGFCAIADPINFNEIPNPNETRPEFKEVPHLTEDEAREALGVFVSEHCCYGSAPVKNLTFNNLKSSNTYRYILETYTETRKTQYVHEPYYNQPIVNTGVPPPRPWDILVQPSILFQDQEVKLEIPNTSHVEVCRNCSGVGTKICYSCGGRGRKHCFHCNGRGYRYENNVRHHCNMCCGSGFSGCITCSRSGRIICRVCQGNGRLKWYLQLVVNFKNNKDDFIKKSENIPDENLRACIAKNTFLEANSRVYPIHHHIDADINQASANLINNHLTRFSQVSRILHQRHEVNTIPTTLASYNFNNKTYSYQVFGLDHKVYAPEYPRKCLCCTIL